MNRRLPPILLAHACRIATSVLLALVTLIGTAAHAAVTTYADRSAWQAAAGTPTTIDFSTKDDGTPITDPPAQVTLDPLVLRGVTFSPATSYYNQFLFIMPNPGVVRITLPPGTRAAGMGLTPYYNVNNPTYTLKVSTGGVVTTETLPATYHGAPPSGYDFVGVTSTSAIEWIEVSGQGSSYPYPILDDFSFVAPPPVQQVNIAIKSGEGGAAKSVNPRSAGVIPVAILSSSSFDATKVDANSVRFGRAGTEAPYYNYSLQDANGDGLIDMVLQFRTQQTGIRCGDTSAKLTGKTQAGQQIAGTDSVQTTGCK